MSDWVDFISTALITSTDPIVKVIHGHPIALFQIDGEFYAIEDLCTHQALPLSDGPLNGDVITCPYHGAQFCIKSGEVMSPPAFEDLPTFEVRVVGEMVQVKIS
jgi:3-phenylpropionate/trans-cinnamate dioxygenase ferredoxin subunit